MHRSPAAGLLLVLLVAAPAAAQLTPGPPGPYVLDARGVTASVPEDATFYPPLGTAAVVPRRGYGIELGGHVYLFNVGPARVGLGATLLQARATAQPVVPASTTSTSTGSSGSTSTGTTTTPGTTTPVAGRVVIAVQSVGPQVSFNFGSDEGWSYLSAGIGLASVSSRSDGPPAGERDSGTVRDLNVGGGARWFLNRHVGIGFDLRFHRLAAGEVTPGTMKMVVGAGLSLK